MLIWEVIDKRNIGFSEKKDYLLKNVKVRWIIHYVKDNNMQKDIIKYKVGIDVEEHI